MRNCIRSPGVHFLRWDWDNYNARVDELCAGTHGSSQATVLLFMMLGAT